jgi:hypothetical protein
VRRVLVGVGEQWLGEPRPDVLLPPLAAERSTSIEIRVTTAERNAFVDVGRVAESS